VDIKVEILMLEKLSVVIVPDADGIDVIGPLDAFVVE